MTQNEKEAAIPTDGLGGIEMLTRLMLRKLNAEYGRRIQTGLSMSQFLILETLRGEGKKTCTELADALQITLPAVTNLTNKLVSCGLAERCSCEKDRRVVYMKLTEKGRALLQEIDVKSEEIIRAFWKELSPDEIGELSRLLGKALTYTNSGRRE
jgi:DNA-binding MarR family transcriptional regulator